MTRRVAVSTYYFINDWNRDQTEVFETISELGFDGVEISLYAQPDINPAAMRAKADECGLDILVSTGVPAEADPSSPYEYVRAASVEYLSACLQTTAEMGGALLGGLTYSPWMLFPDGADPNAARKRVVGSLRKVASVAEKLDIKLCLEAVNRFETYVLNTAAQGSDLIDEIGSDHVALQLDTFHMNIEENDVPTAIRATGTRLGHFQVADNDRSVPGMGSMDFVAMGSALDDIGYDGWISLETFPHPGTGVGNDTFTWRPLVSDHGKDAAAGLALIRSALGGVKP